MKVIDFRGNEVVRVVPIDKAHYEADRGETSMEIRHYKFNRDRLLLAASCSAKATCVRKGMRVLTPLNPPRKRGEDESLLITGGKGRCSLPANAEGWGGVCSHRATQAR